MSCSSSTVTAGRPDARTGRLRDVVDVEPEPLREAVGAVLDPGCTDGAPRAGERPRGSGRLADAGGAAGARNGSGCEPHPDAVR